MKADNFWVWGICRKPDVRGLSIPDETRMFKAVGEFRSLQRIEKASAICDFEATPVILLLLTPKEETKASLLY